MGDQGLYPGNGLTPIMNYNSNSSITDLNAVLAKENRPATLETVTQSVGSFDAKEQQMQTDLELMYQTSQSNASRTLNTQHETTIKYGTTFPQKRRSKRGPTQTYTNNTNMIYFDRTHSTAVDQRT